MIRSLLLPGDFEVTIYDWASSRGNRDYYSYSLWDSEGNELFKGDDFSPSPMDSIDSDGAIACLLGYLTLKPGDTDDEYFEDYTKEQMAFCESDIAQEICLVVFDFENEDSSHHITELPYEDITESY